MLPAPQKLGKDHKALLNQNGGFDVNRRKFCFFSKRRIFHTSDVLGRMYVCIYIYMYIYIYMVPDAKSSFGRGKTMATVITSLTDQKAFFCGVGGGSRRGIFFKPCVSPLSLSLAVVESYGRTQNKTLPCCQGTLNRF